MVDRQAIVSPGFRACHRDDLPWAVVAADLLIVSDTHLAPDNRPAAENWDAVVDHVAATRPDLVLHLGDLTVNGADRLDHLRFARRQLDRLPVPWMALPGNHDLGDNPVAGFDHDSVVDDRRRQRWLDEIGRDRWRLDLDGWTVLGVNAQLLGSGLAAEARQWDWLAGELAAVGAGGSPPAHDRRRRAQPVRPLSHR